MLLRVAQTNLQLYQQLAESDWSSENLQYVRAAYELAATRFAGLLRPNGKCFLAHLVGTASITAQHGGNRDFTSVALLHAWRTHAYHRLRWRIPGMRGGFPRQLAPALCDGIRLYETMHQRLWLPQRIQADLQAFSACEKSAVLVHLANELEEFVDNGMLCTNSGKAAAKSDASHIDTLCRLAEALGKPVLAAQLRDAVASDAHRPLPATLTSMRSGSYAPAHESPSSVLRRWPIIRR